MMYQSIYTPRENYVDDDICLMGSSVALASPSQYELNINTGISISKRLNNLLCLSFFCYFNFRDVLEKKTSQPKIRAEMLEG